MASLEEWAKRYAEVLCPVFPLLPKEKRPATLDGFKSASRFPDVIAGWWAKTPDANIGGVPPDGVLVLDIDDETALGRLQAERGYELPETVLASTGKGLHYWLRHPLEDLGPRAGVLPGVDIRAGGSYVVLPPSIHPNGKKYAWVRPPAKTEIADAPDWLLELLRKDLEPRGDGPDPRVVEAFDGVPEGERDESLYRYACRLRAKSLDRKEAEELLLAAAAKCSPPFSEKEALEKVAEAWKRPPGRSRERERREAGEEVEIIPVETLLATNYLDPTWLVPGLIPSGLIVLSAAPKIGKSFFALSMATAISAGGMILGKVRTSKGEVLYLDLEQPARKTKKRLLQVAREDDPDIHGIYFAHSWKRLDRGGLEELEKFLAENPRVRMVVIDVLAKVVGDLPSGGNIYESEYRRYSDLKSVFDRYNVAGVCIHHDNKRFGEGGDPIDRVSGSRALVAAADALVILTRNRGESDGVLYATGREIEDSRVKIIFDPISKQWILGEKLPAMLFAEAQEEVEEIPL